MFAAAKKSPRPCEEVPSPTIPTERAGSWKPGFSGADLANMVNEAALNAAA